MVVRFRGRSNRTTYGCKCKLDVHAHKKLSGMVSAWCHMELNAAFKTGVYRFNAEQPTEGSHRLAFHLSHVKAAGAGPTNSA